MAEFREILAALLCLQPNDLRSDRKIRIGPRNDGGYILVDRLRPSQRVFSYGLSWNIFFEMELAERGLDVFAFDHTITATTVSHERLNFFPEGLAASGDEAANVRSLADHVDTFAAGARDMILKLDIEGSEWEALQQVPEEVLQRFEQIVIEFHWLHNLGNPAWRARMIGVLQFLNARFSVFHVHANNHAPIVLVDGIPVADVLEVSYVRSDLADVAASQTIYPTTLDAPNNSAVRDHLLWFYPFMPLAGSDQLAPDRLHAIAERIEHQVVREPLPAEQPAVPVEVVRSPGTERKERSGAGLKILCVSVHPVLEYDEIQLFEAMGHEVFSLGFFMHRNQTHTDTLRAPLAENDWHRECFGAFSASGCQANVPDGIAYLLTAEFCRRFDVVIVHHNYLFIDANWHSFAGVPVIWRTVGQGMHLAEQAMRPYRSAVKIVRWSPEERRIEGYIGEDAVIRAAKDPRDWAGWKGDTLRIVTFNNDFVARSNALSLDFYRQAVSGLPAELYGLRNESLERWRGSATYDAQRHLLRSSRVGFVTGTNPAPYTLSFAEAWMIGIPVVHVGRRRFSLAGPNAFEVDHLIDHGINGFLVDEVSEARECFIRLFADAELAKRVSANGREAAIKTFGRDRAAAEWGAFFRAHVL